MRRPIAVFLPKSADSLVAIMGILYSGNIYAPLDVHSPAARIKNILEHLEDPLVITSDEHKESLLAMGVTPEDIIAIEEAYDEAVVYDNAAVLAHLDGLIDTDPIYIIHTSGSTGTPKGVVSSHKGVINYIDWAVACFDITSKEIIGSQSPFYFDNSTLDIYLCLATAATLVIIPEHHFAFPVKLMDYVASQNINFVFWVPSVLINVANTKALDHVDSSGLEKILFAGEAMPNKHLNYWRSKPGFPVRQPVWPYRNHGGLYLLQGGAGIRGQRTAADRFSVPECRCHHPERGEPGGDRERDGRTVCTGQLHRLGLLE